MRLKIATLLAGAFLFLTVPAFAVPANFCGSALGDGPTNIGQTLTVGGVVYTGWSGVSTSSQNTQENLSCKFESVGESGLGIFTTGGDGEIDGNQFVQLDISALNASSLTLQIQSLQVGEGFSIVGSDTNGVFGTDPLASGTGNVSDVNSIRNVTFSTSGSGSKYEYIDITGGGNCGGEDVLIDGPTSPTPEPGTYLLMGTGLLMLGFLMRRKFVSVAL